MTNCEKQPTGNINAPEELATKEPTKLLEPLGVAPEETGGTITIEGEDPIVRNPHRVATAAAVAPSADRSP
jgi:hypothetical protein